MKKFLSAILCIALLLSFPTAYAAAGSAKQYPFVFVHGMMGWGEAQGIDSFMPYWGTTSGDVLAYLEYRGYETCSASVGGVSSAWDRACELYAQLMGTRVDYGKAHSEEHGHSRYGRTYGDKLCESFGTKDKNGNIIKVNLVGHSMGGVTIRLFASILEYGVPEEVAVGDDVSDFFTGGKGCYINSISTVSAPHNGSLGADKDNIAYINLILKFFYIMTGVVGNTALRPLWDAQLEQFGFTDYPADGFEGSFSFKLIEQMTNCEDSAYYDLTLQGARELNERIRLLDDVYYYSYHSECVFESPLTGRLYPEPTMNPIFLPVSFIICNYKDTEIAGYDIDSSWRINDGIVSPGSAEYPDGDPHTDYDPADVQPGIWNVMPVENSMDHTDFMGIFCDPVRIRKFYKGVCETACAR